jgi:S1-C subfamily serine protease
MSYVPTIDIYDAVKKATVAIVWSTPGQTPLPYSISGSGFCIDPAGVIVTCNHVFKPFLTPETHERVEQARQRAADETVLIHGEVPHVLFYLGVQEHERRINTYLVPVHKAVTDEKYGFDLAVLKLFPNNSQFPDGYPTLQIADYADLHEMMDVATCGFPLGNVLFEQLGTFTSSFTRGIISSIIPAQGVSRAHVRGFQLDLTATNGNSGGPVFSVGTGRVFGVLQGAVTHPQSGQHVPLVSAEPVYPVFDTDMLARLSAPDFTDSRT